MTNQPCRVDWPDRYGRWIEGDLTPIDPQTLKPYCPVLCATCGRFIGAEYLVLRHNKNEAVHAYRLASDWEWFENELHDEGFSEVVQSELWPPDDVELAHGTGVYMKIPDGNGWGREVYVCTQTGHCAGIYFWSTAHRRNNYHVDQTPLFKHAQELKVPFRRPDCVSDLGELVAGYLDFMARYKRKVDRLERKAK